MRKLLVLFLVVCALSVFLVAPRKRWKRLDLKPPLTTEEITAERLFRRFTEEEDYTKYPHWPGREGIRPGQSPHGDLHEVFIHPYLYEALPIRSKTAPNGSLVIKCNMNAQKEVVAFTIMAKVKGYDPEANDWFWAKMSKEGIVEAEGRVKGCIECHKLLKNNDYLILYQLDKKP